MAFYRLKPPVVEAIQWDGTNITELQQLIAPTGDPLIVEHSTFNAPTPDGDQVVAIGDWVVKSAKGDIYVMSDEEFNEKFEAI